MTIKNDKSGRWSRFFTYFLMAGVLLAEMTTAQAQRLEVRFNKEFSNDSLLNKTLGAGGSFIFDCRHDHLDFQIDFDYAGHSGKTNMNGISNKITKFKAGAGALYTRPLGNLFHLRAGGNISYNNIHRVVTNHRDSIATGGISNTAYHAHYLGCGAMVQAQVRLGRLFRLGLSIIPEYLILVSDKANRPTAEYHFKKGIFILQMQVGLEIKLNND